MKNIEDQVEWLGKLIAHNTVSSRSNLELIQTVDSYLKSLGVKTYRTYDEGKQKANLYAIIGPKVEGGVILSGHTDVVPVEGQVWNTDPWQLTEKDGKYFGRGTCDMKAFLAICISLVPKMLKVKLKRPIILAFSYDEEIGCLGAPKMIEDIKRKLPLPSVVIVGEPTMMDPVVGHKGISSYEVNINGYATHSSQTEKGVSAVEVAAELIGRLAAMRREKSEKSRLSNPFDPPYSTITTNVIRGGTQLNIMAQSCSFNFDLRSVPDEKPEDITREFIDFISKLEFEIKQKSENCKIELKELTNVPPFSPRNNDIAMKLLQSLVESNETKVVSFASEAGQFQEAGFSTVICGPGSINQAHKPNEFIERSQLESGTLFLQKLIELLSLD